MSLFHYHLILCNIIGDGIWPSTTWDDARLDCVPLALLIFRIAARGSLVFRAIWCRNEEEREWEWERHASMPPTHFSDLQSEETSFDIIMCKPLNSNLGWERAHFLFLLCTAQPHGAQSKQPRQQRNSKGKCRSRHQYIPWSYEDAFTPKGYTMLHLRWYQKWRVPTIVTIFDIFCDSGFCPNNVWIFEYWVRQTEQQMFRDEAADDRVFSLLMHRSTHCCSRNE